jgi:hypothetical protein
MWEPSSNKPSKQMKTHDPLGIFTGSSSGDWVLALAAAPIPKET